MRRALALVAVATGWLAAAPAWASGTCELSRQIMRVGSTRLSPADAGSGRVVSPRGVAGSNPQLGVHFEGLNFVDQISANGGNQLSVEPPDQGLCVGNGFVVETVNQVIQVFRTDGSPATGVVALNEFYRYPPAIDRATGTYGPAITDPSCLYDRTTGRFIHVALTLEVKPTEPDAGALLGPNHIDIAVSDTSDPTGSWTLYRLPAQDDGTEGTPDHGCRHQGTPPAYRTNPDACVGDYPHIGVDRHGLYISTNEYELFGDTFVGAQIYAISKAQLAASPQRLTVTQLDTSHAAPGGKPGFTVWPAQSPDTQFADGRQGTEYFLSSTAADEAQCDSLTLCTGTGTSDDIVLWALTNTSSLGAACPSLALSNAALAVDTYSIPPKSNQPASGDWPLGQCLNIPECATLVLGEPDPFTEEISRLDSSDTRMQQVFYADGKVWGALDTDVVVGGAHKAGIQYFAVSPDVRPGEVRGRVALDGTLALAGNNVTYPAIAVLANGRGVMAFTLVGDDHYPSAGYVLLDACRGAGDIHIAAAGAGLHDGFTGYKAFVGDPPRTRWGDYGAAAVDGNHVWIASEYVAQSCTLEEWLEPPIGSCGGTRGPFGNWSTHVSQITP